MNNILGKNAQRGGCGVCGCKLRIQVFRDIMLCQVMHSWCSEESWKLLDAWTRTHYNILKRCPVRLEAWPWSNLWHWTTICVDVLRQTTHVSVWIYGCCPSADLNMVKHCYQLRWAQIQTQHRSDTNSITPISWLYCHASKCSEPECHIQYS
jgi:hypothetical protein